MHIIQSFWLSIFVQDGCGAIFSTLCSWKIFVGSKEATNDEKLLNFYAFTMTLDSDSTTFFLLGVAGLFFLLRRISEIKFQATIVGVCRLFHWNCARYERCVLFVCQGNRKWIGRDFFTENTCFFFFFFLVYSSS